ncbi:MAG: hypothetical protein M1833_004768 [Piccolia ochrophora]|nr:MAG: hypothetical protein M1833_004768 [Piccolia ochrophora]
MQLTKSILFFTAAFSATAYADCFESGAYPSQQSKDSAKRKVPKFCARRLVGDYAAGQARTHCLSDGVDFRWDFLTQLRPDVQDRPLPLDECISGLTKEIDGCDRGGDSTYDNWHYKADINKGPC